MILLHIIMQMYIFFSFPSAGGLFTGADERKTEEERVTYGGLANAILDPCYHQVYIIYMELSTDICDVRS